MSNTSTIAIPYPWQSATWQQLHQQIQGEHLPHALLLSGLLGVGKRQLASALAQRLLCERPAHDLACGQCKGCHLVNAHTHPDLMVIEPESDGKQIKIDEVRSIQGRVQGAPQLGGRKVVVIGPAENLNLNAANALLKTLEEPPGATHILLYTHQLSAVLPTIKSRCQVLKLPVPDKETSLNWLTTIAGDRAEALLTAARGLPVKAMAMLDGEFLAEREQVRGQLAALSDGSTGPMAAAQKLKSYAVDQVCLHMIDYTESAVYQLTNRADATARWQENTKNLLQFRDKVLELLKKVRSGANPNSELVIENLLIDYTRLNLS